MRTDARIDRKQVACPNASHLGFDKYKAQFGDIVVFNESDKSKVGRVIGRIDYAPALGETPAIRNYLVVAALTEDLTHVSERWVNPEDVTRVFDPNEESRNIPALINFFFSPKFRDESVDLLRRWTDTGFATPNDYLAWELRAVGEHRPEKSESA